MKENELLRVIRGRRSVLRFEPDPIPDEDLQAILEAGRWAPSFANSQPWAFVVVRDAEKKQQLGDLVERVAFSHRGQPALSGKGVGNAPVVIAVGVDPVKDPHHHLEAGAVAAQNMALMAHSLGYASFWAGVARRGPEAEVRKILGLPRGWRVVALLPIGKPAYTPRDAQRVPLTEIVRYDSF